MGGGKGSAGCDQDMRTYMYSARPRRTAKPQAIRANGATHGAAHVTAGMRAKPKGTCASVRRDRRERRRWPEGRAVRRAKDTDGEESHAEVGREGREGTLTNVTAGRTLNSSVGTKPGGVGV